MKLKLILVLSWIILSATIIVGAVKSKSDKERISVLEQQVSALNEVVSTQGAWQAEVEKTLQVMNAREWDLHERVQTLEHLGPVARNQ